ncbi:MAG: hypothetical protein RR626_00720 [Anaerovoracaceae bacterium]
MHRRMLAQSLLQWMQGDKNYTFLAEGSYEDAPLSAAVNKIDIAVIEVRESGENPAMEALLTANGIKKRCANSKVLILCPESSEKSKAAVVLAKQKNLIDDFVFYDASLEYLMKKIEAIS